MKVWLDGKLVDKDDAKVSVFDHGVLYGDGVFEGIRIYHGKMFETRAHIVRLFESAAKIALVIPYTPQELIDATYETMKANGVEDGYVRMVVTRGEGTLGVSPSRCHRACAFIIVDQIALYPPEMYENGMEVIVAKTVRTSATMLDPGVKSLNYLNNILAKIEANNVAAGEAIMLNVDGYVAECTGDNLFMVKDGKLITPPVSAGILEGITRAVVLMLARRMEITTEEILFRPEALFKADECFLTGTAAEVIAVTHINGKKIGSGKAGPMTRKLLDAFRAYIRSGEEM